MVRSVLLEGAQLLLLEKQGSSPPHGERERLHMDGARGRGTESRDKGL